jgi:hypothetical protein
MESKGDLKTLSDSILGARFSAAIKVSPRFPFYPDELSGCSLQSGLGGLLGGAIFGCLPAQAFVTKPGSSDSPRFFIGATANNGAAVSEELLNDCFQKKNINV